MIKLLKSYDPAALLWADRDHRHLMAVAILTRGNQEAKDWLWSVLSIEEVREYRGACCGEPERAELSNELALTMSDKPPRTFVPFGQPWDKSGSP